MAVLSIGLHRGEQLVFRGTVLDFSGSLLRPRKVVSQPFDSIRFNVKGGHGGGGGDFER